MSISYGPRTVHEFGWSQTVEVAGVTYECVIRRGKRVKIAYKPRGHNIGHRWEGRVYEGEKMLFLGLVRQSLGCRGLLKLAGVLPSTPKGGS